MLFYYLNGTDDYLVVQRPNLENFLNINSKPGEDFSGRCLRELVSLLQSHDCGCKLQDGKK
jgi:hypothetical protein